MCLKMCVLSSSHQPILIDFKGFLFFLPRLNFTAVYMSFVCVFVCVDRDTVF